jgi:hypothetical protein
MDWRKILMNIVAVATGCLAMQKSGLMDGNPDWGSVGVGVLMCVVSNQIGLHQQRP